MSPWKGALIPTPSRESPAPVDIAALPPSTSPGGCRVAPNYSQMSPSRDHLISTPFRELPAPAETAARPRNTVPGDRRVSPNSIKNLHHRHSQAHKQPRNSQEEALLTLPYQCRSRVVAGISPFALARDQDPLR